MCWTGDNTAVRKIAERDFYVYKIGKIVWNTIFVSDIRGHNYVPKCPNRIVPLMPYGLGVGSCRIDRGYHSYKCWARDTFRINEGYHSYLTKKMAEHLKSPYEKIGIFEIPSGATIYVNYRYEEVVSTDIKYLGVLE